MTTVLNPATEEPIAEIEPATSEQTDAAVARAKAAFAAWRIVVPADRARLLRRLATLVEEHHEELSRIESRNAGKPAAAPSRPLPASDSLMVASATARTLKSLARSESAISVLAFTHRR